MENDEKILNFNESNELKFNNTFKLDYLNQNLRRNADFQKWKNSMIEEYGRDAKLFTCKYEKLLFYTSNEDCKNYPFYQSICPSCKRPICYYCHRYGRDSYGNGTCCLRRKLYCFFFQDGLRLINPIDPENDYKPKLRKLLFYFFIPGLNLLLFMAEIHVALFYKLSLKNDEDSGSGYLSNYEEHFKRNYIILQIIVGIDIAFSVVLTFSFILLNIYFIIFLTIISLPFKLYPMKYYMGIAYGTIT